MPSRRTYLVGVATGVTGSLAGCFGGGTTTEGELSAPVLGNPDADVVVKSWEDFQCPHCAHFHLEVLPDIEADYAATDTIRFERHDFPIPINQLSWTVAVAARSVQAQAGDEAYYEFADRAYERQSGMNVEVIRDIASNTEANADQVVEEAQNGAYRDTVEADRQEGRNVGVSATPSVFVNGEQVSNTYQSVASAIENAK